MTEHEWTVHCWPGLGKKGWHKMWSVLKPQLQSTAVLPVLLLCNTQWFIQIPNASEAKNLTVPQEIATLLSFASAWTMWSTTKIEPKISHESSWGHKWVVKVLYYSLKNWWSLPFYNVKLSRFVCNNSREKLNKMLVGLMVCKSIGYLSLNLTILSF